MDTGLGVVDEGATSIMSPDVSRRYMFPWASAVTPVVLSMGIAWLTVPIDPLLALSSMVLPLIRELALFAVIPLAALIVTLPEVEVISPKTKFLLLSKERAVISMFLPALMLSGLVLLPLIFAWKLPPTLTLPMGLKIPTDVSDVTEPVEVKLTLPLSGVLISPRR